MEINQSDETKKEREMTIFLTYARTPEKQT